MKKIFIIFTVMFSTLSYSVNAQTILHTNASDKIDISENSEITPDLFPQTSRYMHDLNMRLIYALKPALDEYIISNFCLLFKKKMQIIYNYVTIV